MKKTWSDSNAKQGFMKNSRCRIRGDGVLFGVGLDEGTAVNFGLRPIESAVGLLHDASGCWVRATNAEKGLLLGTGGH